MSEALEELKSVALDKAPDDDDLVDLLALALVHREADRTDNHFIALGALRLLREVEQLSCALDSIAVSYQHRATFESCDRVRKAAEAEVDVLKEALWTLAEDFDVHSDHVESLIDYARNGASPLPDSKKAEGEEE